MRKVAAIAAALALGTGAVTACSGDDNAYCDELRTTANVVKPGDNESAKSIDLMKKVRDKAPSEVEDDWTTMIEFVEKSQAAEGDATKLAELAKDAGKVTTATQNISKHAKDSCKIDIPTT